MTSLFVPSAGFALCLGFADRHDPAWAAAFYPDGMPADWQVNYLALMTEAIVLNPRDVDYPDALAACRAAPKSVQGVWTGDAAPTEADALSLPWLPWVGGTEWTPGSAVQGARVGCLSPGLSPRALRDALEGFARQAPAEACVLLMTGGAAAVPLFEQASAMQALLGW